MISFETAVSIGAGVMAITLGSMIFYGGLTILIQVFK